jgi:hypothetical protein
LAGGSGAWQRFATRPPAAIGTRRRQLDRATAEDRFLDDCELAVYHTETGRGGEKPTWLHFGQTSPIYVTCGGAGARVERSVSEARRMLDGFERFAHAASRDPYRAEISEALATARARLG